MSHTHQANAFSGLREKGAEQISNKEFRIIKYSADLPGQKGLKGTPTGTSEPMAEEGQNLPSEFCGFLFDIRYSPG
jgi:hypothetical protein